MNCLPYGGSLISDLCTLVCWILTSRSMVRPKDLIIGQRWKDIIKLLCNFLKINAEGVPWVTSLTASFDRN